MIKNVLIIWILLCGVAIGSFQTDIWESIREGSTFAWSVHLTGQDVNDVNDYDQFKSVAVVPTSTGEDEVWTVVSRTVDSNTVQYIEKFQPLDWYTDINDAKHQ